MKFAAVIGTVLVGGGLFGLALVGQNELRTQFQARTFQAGLPSPTAGGAMLVSGAILLFSGKNKVS